MIKSENIVLINQDINQALILLAKGLTKPLFLKIIDYNADSCTVHPEFKELNASSGIIEEHSNYIHTKTLIKQFIYQLTPPELAAIGVYTINDAKYYSMIVELAMEYDGEEIVTTGMTANQIFDARIGQVISEILNGADNNIIEQWMNNFLFEKVTCLASEFDLSLIDDSFNEEMYEQLGKYC